LRKNIAHYDVGCYEFFAIPQKAINMQLREVVPEDIADLAALMSELGYDSTEAELQSCIDRYQADENSWAMGIEIDGRLVASASYHVTPTFHRPGGLLRVTSLVVNREYRRLGLGRQLIEKADDLARATGCDRVELSSASHRAAQAYRFYESIGFVKYEGTRFLRQVDLPGAPTQ